MRYFIMIVVCAAFISCKTTHNSRTITAGPVVTPVRTDTVADAHGHAMLLGHHLRSALQQKPFDKWFDSAFAAYKPDAVAIDEIKAKADRYRVEIFMGTWCGDSKREVPKLLRSLENAGFDTSHIDLIMVGNESPLYKISPQHEEAGKAIFRVPTAIIVAGDKEVGRIIEHPKQSWEKDLSAIMNGAAYEPLHAVGNAYFKALEAGGDPDAVIGQAMTNGQLSTSGELNAIGYVLLGQDKISKAIDVFKMNTRLFPKDPNVWDSLAEAYATIGKKGKALRYYRMVLELEPGDQNAKKQIDSLSQ